MSLNSALSAGASGLLANSNALAAISDNIANVNTIAYKRTETVFNPLVETQGNVNQYSAGGVGSSSRQVVSRQGTLSSTASATDLAISGEGFFVVTEKPDNLEASDPRLFTRSGSFTPDSEGYLRNTAGFYLQGWPVQSDGDVVVNPTDLTALETVNVSAIGGTADATSNLVLNANLDSRTDISTAAGGGGGAVTYDPTDGLNNMANGAVEPDFSSSVQVFDSLGGLRTVTFAYLKSATPNEWYAEVYVSPAADVIPVAPLVNGQLATGNVSFTSSGLLDTAATTLPLSLAIGGFDGTQPVDNLGNPITVSADWAAGTGIAAQTFDLTLGGASSTGGLTQLASPSTLLSSNVDGSAFGDLDGVEINQEGDVLARFRNGVIRKVYQLPVGTFLNPDGLQTQRSGGAYVVSEDSGQFTLKEAGVGGAGLVEASSLEDSTVDLAAEFTGMIVTQRAYSAASRVITVADEMLEELIRVVR